ncbi:hypothetical protein C8Q70DRAFT_915546 [Cubamyces menziesii]|uniref:Protein bir1 n=1 Tax=Trametes cubensis TaxID=1111947 RepID=A0AAD7XBM9_9APHY|nr:hypothetical protein C8Q70DRAFT_915546 [Cubamyces menziesii]KAJ8482502.1 hypothetical protein ONZ51_g5334 [Trametes cubensis]
MEYFQARLDSFAPSKPKRTKASSSKQASAAYRWPHPPTWKATPNSLAEAGFYFTPGPNEPDNVTCFMCKKNLCNWEPEDDPFEVHYDKCGDKCAWAVVRCQKPQDNGSYDFSDPARHPTSKTMEKARLDTFAKAEWPHDGAKGHGANSRALAKAGFVWNASEPGDDTAICLYCNLSLGGWDEDDDPYQEHLKRDKKHKTSCAFLKAYTDSSLNKSTAKRPSKTVAKAPSRSASQVLKNTDEEVLDASDDELAAATFSGTGPPRASNPRASKSRASRASSAPTKTPASRRSTRGTSTGGKTPASRVTISSEVEDTDVGSESETGKRASKPSRKAGGRSKARVSAIAEEDDEEEPMHTQPDEDVVMQDQGEEQEQEPVKEKRKRGRPPKATASAKPGTKVRTKKTEEPEATEDAADSDLAAAPPPPAAKKSHARTRSKANIDSEVDAPTKPTHTRTKSASKVKVKQEEEERLPPPAPIPKKKGKQKAAPTVAEDGEDVPGEDVPVPPPKMKGKASAPSRSKIKHEPEDAAVDEEVRFGTLEPVYDPAPDDHLNSQPARAPSRRTPSLSDDAGYATAEPPVDPDRMDVDTAYPTARPPSSKTQKSAVNGSRPAPHSNGTGAVKRQTPPSNDPAHQSSAPSSRASSSRPTTKIPPQRIAAKESLKVIEIDSDGEDAAAQEAPHPSKATHGPASSSNLKKPASKASGRKLQVEVILPPKTARSHQEPEDIEMQQVSPTSPARSNIARSPNAPAAVRPEPPGTPVSAVHRSTQVSPARPAREGLEHDADVHDPSPRQAAAGTTTPQTYHPVLAQFPIEALTSLTEEEGEMTLEQYIRRETELQYAQFKADAERRIEEFKQRAAEARRLIETS